MIDWSLRAHRLNKRSQFTLIASKGKRIHSGALSLKQVASSDGETRIAFIIRKKCGKAVFRNRVRRILRHAFYQNFQQAESKPFWGTVQYFGKESDFQVETLRLQAQGLFCKLGWESK